MNWPSSRIYPGYDGKVTSLNYINLSFILSVDGGDEPGEHSDRNRAGLEDG